jgi:photosystem II stability/assembly factor-like uncharacterized protein
LRQFGWFVSVAIFVSALLLLNFTAVGQPVPAEYVNGLKWRLIGPFRGGRAVAAAGVPGDSTTFYFGSVNGGVWKTTDAGMVWTPIFEGQPVASIGALAVAASDPKVIYVGTGESDIREDLSSGNGIYKSTDAGATWTHIGLEGTRQISRIVIDPRDPNVVYVGALGHVYKSNNERGVFKSTDGGAHWTHVLDLGAEIGISDLAMCAGSPQVLFAGAWHTHRPPWSGYAPIDGAGSGLYRSQDAGKTWARLEGNGLPDGEWGRVGVDVAPDGRRAYALIEVKNPNSKKSGLYRSDDGGNTWTLANTDDRLTSRAWYFNSVTIDPRNSDVIYIPNVAVYRSEDGGKTISVVRGAPGGDDYHLLWVDPKNSASLVLATDQGTTVSLDRGQTWSSWYNQPTGQFYHVTTDNQFPYVLYGTQQDSGSAAVYSRTDHGSITPRDWFLPGGSESGYIVVDPHDPNIIYLSGTYGTVARFDKRTGFSQDISPWPAFAWDAEVYERKYRDPWTPVLVLSPVDLDTIYLGTQYVMKTIDGGLHWETISPDLTGAAVAKDRAKNDLPTLEEAKRGGYGVVFTIAPSPVDRNLIWAGTDTGLIQLTRDGGKSWKDITPPGVSDWSKVSMIEASHFDAAVAYAAVDRSRLDDQTPYIYRTRDYGATWKLISTGVGASAFVRSIREDPKTKGLLFAGTETGIYASWDDGDHWQSLQLNLPVSSVRDLAIHGDDLVAATFGRAFWILDNIAPLRQAMEAEKTRSAWLYPPANAVRVDNDSFSGTPLPPEESAAENPPNGAMVDYFLPTTASSVRLEVFDDHKNLVRKFTSEDVSAKSERSSSQGQPTWKHQPLPVADRWFPKPEILERSPGLHRFVWNLTWGSSGGPDADEDAEYNNPTGPKAVPGNYELRLTVDGKTQSQSLTAPLTVNMDPRSTATAEVLAKQFQLGQKMFGEAMKARRVLNEIASVQKQLAEAQERSGQQKSGGGGLPLKPALDEAQVEIKAILILTNQQRGSDARGLQGAYSALASALRVVESGDREVPSQAIEVYEQASPQVKAGEAAWDQFKQTKLERLNQQLRAAGSTPVELRNVEP